MQLYVSSLETVPLVLEICKLSLNIIEYNVMFFLWISGHLGSQRGG